MAAKKPAKPHAGKNVQPVLDPAVYGTKVLYAGMKHTPAVCTCGTRIVRGMMRLKGDDIYCSPTCAAHA